MKIFNRLTFVFSLSVMFVCIIFASCRKKIITTTAPPKVSLSSVAYYGLDTVIAKATILSNGGGEISAEGFICSTNPDFSGYPSQISAYGTTNFSSLIPAKHYVTYYFKAFATNSNGTSYSNVIKFTVPPPASATAPCTLSNNVITDSNKGTYTVSVLGDASNATWGNYEVNFYGPVQDVYMYFYDLPHNGIYTTVADPSNISAGQVSIGMSGFSGTSINDGQKVYVALDAATQKTIITFCSLSYNTGGFGPFYISGKGMY